MKRYLKTLLFTITSALTLTGCGVIDNIINDLVPQDNPAYDTSEDLTPAKISLSKSSVKLNTNQSVNLYATLLNANDHRSNIQTVTWTSSDSSVSITPSYDGSVASVKATANGTYSVTASYGDFSQSCTVEVVSETIPDQKKLNYTYMDYIKNTNYYLSSAPTLNSTKLLIVPVWFTDSTSYIDEDKKENVRQDIEKAYLGTEGETGWHSVKSFYETESRGRLSYEGVVTDWYACGKKSTSYYSETTGADNTRSLVSSAVSWYKRTYGVSNMKDFDRDGDGYIDGVMLIYGAPDSRTYSKNNDNMWAYCYWLQKGNPSVSSPNPNAFFWASYDFMYSSDTAEERAGHPYGGGDTNHSLIDAHTFIHEMGHVFGLEDYYDYSNQACPAGAFSMQDYNVGSHDPYSRLGYGWDNVYVPTTTSTFHVDPYQESGDLVLLSTHNSSITSPFDEYILLELYTPTSLNQLDSTYSYINNYPTGSTQAGFRVWHVDSRLVYLTSRSDYPSYSASRISTTPTSGRYYHLMMSNTYYSSSYRDYASVLGSSYGNYNILQLIRNNTIVNYKPGTDNFFNSEDLFKSGSSFEMAKYGKQFVTTGTMNDGSALGWKVTFTNVSSSGADITVTKL